MAGSDIPHCRRQGEDCGGPFHSKRDNYSLSNEVIPGRSGRSGGRFTGNRKANIRVNRLSPKGSRHFHVLDQAKQLGTIHTCEVPGTVSSTDPGAMTQEVTHRNVCREVRIRKLYCGYISSYRLVPDIFFSSTNDATAAAVNDFVSEAASKIVFSSIGSGFPNSRTPYPLAAITFPSFTTAMATPGISQSLTDEAT